MNQFTGMGRLTRDPEIKTTTSGISVCSFGIAINRRFKNASGEYEADFLNCVAWRQTGEFISKYFHKGSMIGIVGTVQTRNYENKDGQKVYVTEIVVEQAHFCGGKNEAGSAPSNNASASKADFPEAIDLDDDVKLPFDL